MHLHSTSARFARNASLCRKYEIFKKSGCDEVCSGRASKCKKSHMGCFCVPGRVRHPGTMTCMVGARCPPALIRGLKVTTNSTTSQSANVTHAANFTTSQPEKNVTANEEKVTTSSATTHTTDATTFGTFTNFSCHCNCPSTYQPQCDANGQCIACHMSGSLIQEPCAYKKCIKLCKTSSDCRQYCGNGSTSAFPFFECTPSNICNCRASSSPIEKNANLGACRNNTDLKCDCSEYCNTSRTEGICDLNHGLCQCLDLTRINEACTESNFCRPRCRTARDCPSNFCSNSETAICSDKLECACDQQNEILKPVTMKNPIINF